METYQGTPADAGPPGRAPPSPCAFSDVDEIAETSSDEDEVAACFSSRPRLGPTWSPGTTPIEVDAGAWPAGTGGWLPIECPIRVAQGKPAVVEEEEEEVCRQSEQGRPHTGKRAPAAAEEQRGVPKRARRSKREAPYHEEVRGRMLEIYWPNERTWYRGTVDAYDARLGQHHVTYDDGDKFWYTLKKEEDRKHLRWIGSSAETSYRRSRARGGGRPLGGAQACRKPHAGRQAREFRRLQTGGQFESARKCSLSLMDNVIITKEKRGDERQSDPNGFGVIALHELSKVTGAWVHVYYNTYSRIRRHGTHYTLWAGLCDGNCRRRHHARVCHDCSSQLCLFVPT